MKSDPPPGANGTMSFSGFVGYVSAAMTQGARIGRASAARRPRKRSIGGFPSVEDVEVDSGLRRDTPQVGEGFVREGEAAFCVALRGARFDFARIVDLVEPGRARRGLELRDVSLHARVKPGKRLERLDVHREREVPALAA